MSQPYVGEIRMFGGSFAPAGWAFCNGQLMAISENDTLFNLIGTTYGGDGQSTFALPDLQGRLPMHAGQGTGISQNYQIGEKAGVESVTLNSQQTPIHNHSVVTSGDLANSNSPNNSILAQSTQILMYTQDTASKFMAPSALSFIGGNQPHHENMQPYLVISFIISLFGVYPSQG
jgi:microcystin-dependent protein